MKKFAYAALLALGVVALMAPSAAFAADEEKPFTIHGEIRFRGEVSSNTQDFTDQDANATFETDDSASYWPYRVRIAAEGHFTNDVTGWIEFQNGGVLGEQGLFNALVGTPATGENPRGYNDGSSVAQMYQAYINLGKLWSDKFNLRIGRQEVVLGNEFILGDEDFYSGVSHDALVGMWDLDNVDISVWYARTVEDSVIQYTVPFGLSSGQDLPPDLVFIDDKADNIEHLGGYVTFGVGKEKDQDIDVYLVNVNIRGEGGRFQTFGVRYGRENWEKAGLVWNIEYAIQMGDFSSDLVAGFTEEAGGSAAEGLIGWNFKSGDNMHRVYARMEMASGDDYATADEYEGFVPLFGEIHNRAGRGDWFRLQHDATALGGVMDSGGLMAWAVGYTGMYGDKHEFGAQFWDYSSEIENDGWIPGPTYTPSPGLDNESDLGTAFDLWYGYKYSKNVAFEASYSNLSPGEALTGTGSGVPDDSVERLYGQVRLRF